MLSALDMIARQTRHDLTITSGTDGQHSGPDDPHHKGNAFDVRTHDLPDKQIFLNRLKLFLGEEKFYVFIEDPDEVTHADPDHSNEHIHLQLRHGMEYP
jgi:hypothetical protein